MFMNGRGLEGVRGDSWFWTRAAAHAFCDRNLDRRRRSPRAKRRYDRYCSGRMLCLSSWSATSNREYATVALASYCMCVGHCRPIGSWPGADDNRTAM